MATYMNKTSFLCLALATATFAAVPGQAKDTSNDSQVIASLSGVRSNPDPALQKAINFLVESQKAREVKDRRDNVKPVIQDQVVHTRRATADHTMITGIDGASALPM